MTRILEEELNTIMIEVWQALPDDPPTEAEKFVAEKLRYEASDDLKNVLGLNVTKRLLNVHNPLIVKLQITGRPKTGSLQQFVKSYNVKSLRRVGTDSNVYLARLHSISDFDKICKHKDLRCGNAKVVATPIYKFSKCPPKLNSIYSSNEEEESKVENKEDIDGEDKDAETGDSKNITEDTNLQNKDLDEKVIENKDAKPNAKPSKIEDTKISNQTVTKVEQNNKNKSVMTTEKEKTIDNKAETKGGPDNQPKDDIKKVTQTKNNVTEQPVNDIKESDKINKNITQNEKPKVISINKVTIEEERDFLDEEVMEDEIQEFGDGDEMDDEEILALISEGVVVDECSGSEEE